MLTAASSVGVFAVGPNWAQITWGDLSPGVVTFAVGGKSTSIEHAGGPGSYVVEDLPAGSSAEITVTTAVGKTILLPVHTLTEPWGRPLTKFATISDLHLGALRWGFFKTMTEPEGRFDDPYPVRCARAAISEAARWGAELLVIKGDAAQHEDPDCFDMLGRLVDEFPDMPMMLIPGNHDVDDGAVGLPDGLGERRLAFATGVEHLDVDGARIIVANTTKPRYGSGTVAEVKDDLIQAAAEANSPVFVGLHHQLQTTRTPRYYPKGIPAPESTDFLDELGRVQPGAVVSSGHTHRNRVRYHGDVLVTEVASTKDWPGVWGAYAVYEGGICQSVRRTGEPSVMEWTEYSRRAVAGLWSRWSPGRLEDRCLSHVWAGDTHLVG